VKKLHLGVMQRLDSNYCFIQTPKSDVTTNHIKDKRSGDYRLYQLILDKMFQKKN
jgi:hypothetical protein